jgi:haloacetate dehalogenase
VSRDHILNREATVNGIQIHYKIAGGGSPLLLLHGSPLTSCSWLRIMPALTKTHTVIAPDFRGCGQSEKPDAETKWKQWARI